MQQHNNSPSPPLLTQTILQATSLLSSSALERNEKTTNSKYSFLGSAAYRAVTSSTPASVSGGTISGSKPNTDIMSQEGSERSFASSGLHNPSSTGARGQQRGIVGAPAFVGRLQRPSSVAAPAIDNSSCSSLEDVNYLDFFNKNAKILRFPEKVSSLLLLQASPLLC